MRDLRFRAWDGKIMTYPKVVALGINGRNGLPSASFQLNSGGYCTSADVMQFTGLLDKQGKEIYEGDIVKVVEKKEYSKIHKKMRHRSIYGPSYIAPVIWNPVSTGFVMAYKWEDTGRIDDHLRITPKETKVIGNIYENPELIQGVG